VTKADVDANDDEDDQKITLDELLDNLVLDKPDDAEIDDDDMADTEGVFTFDGERAAKDNIGYVGRSDALNIAAKETAVPVAGNTWGKEFMDKDGKFL